ncbi:hypothetical protein CSC81_11865 [Tenacibaculum discolor]|uniref:Serine hydrolase domain-containing protein n=1 Tax=Tenacibaculum discolor TaxID=361581 RepID=A0A2G1BSP7_9FLAO|nr:serine hydrolase domain-containing protein [Tenacibaculum discolor]MDP2542522.1 serine hydrolase domain-containing protein [Tenacibaculum discolor]PHN97101.1 hypothetical protein CSC81_11865 [Tenacibaculum discolor]PHO00984.1 hypothetical protein CSC82_25950 [Rhodobacteraceae bacterium 4F10]
MKKIIILTIFILFNSCNSKKTKPLTTEEINNIVNKEVNNFLKPPYTSLSCVLYIDGVSHQFHFGELIDKSKATNETLYEIGSLTKTYTGLLLSQAVHDKKVNLENNIQTYLHDSYPNLKLHNNTPITLRHLITHTSGLPLNINCTDINTPVEEQIKCFESFTKEDFFTKLKNIKLTHATGKDYNYSNAGVQLVGYILENVYQLSFQELLEKYIFSRSKEQQTSYNTNNKLPVLKGMNNEQQPMPLINSFYKHAGSLVSSTSSIQNYLKMYLESNDPVIKQAMNKLAGNNQHGRAYAWNTYNYDSHKKMLYHNGGTFGHSSWAALYPNQKVGIFLVTNIINNQSQGDLNELSNKIIDKVME